MASARPLDVILQGDAIRPPFTGIGRYALELARGLVHDRRVSRLRFFAGIGWMDDPLAAGLTAGDQGASVSAARIARFRDVMARNRLAVRAYSLLAPRVSGRRLRFERDAIYHSPNYFLPPFPGRSVTTIHDLSHVLFPQFHPAARVDYMNRALPATLARADHLITVSESVRQEVIAHYGWPADRVTAVLNGVDPAFHPRPEAELAAPLAELGLQAQGYCLFVGTIEPRKNVDGLLSAYEMLPTALRQAYPLVLAGGAGWRSEATHERIARAVAAGWARYLSYVDEALLPALYAGARAFAFPSHYEGFGLPVLEAMASGVPVVTSSVSSLPEVAAGCARLVHPGDTDALAAALAEVLEDEGLRARLRAGGLARADELGWQRCVDETVAVYERVMAG